MGVMVEGMGRGRKGEGEGAYEHAEEREHEADDGHRDRERVAAREEAHGRLERAVRVLEHERVEAVLGEQRVLEAGGEECERVLGARCGRLGRSGGGGCSGWCWLLWTEPGDEHDRCELHE